MQYETKFHVFSSSDQVVQKSVDHVTKEGADTEVITV